jgi:hypothetical protein
MTLVVSTVSQRGITVVADCAVSRLSLDAPPVVLPETAEKIIYSSAANIAFAFWGKTFFGGTDYFVWANDVVQKEVTAGTSLIDASDLLAERINEQLAPFASKLHGWGELRRGVHVSGYVDGLPCIYHVHTGASHDANHSLRVHRDFPDVHGGGADAHRQSLLEGKRAQLFNGFHELFGTLGESFGPLRSRLEKDFGVKIPAPTLRGQLELDRTLVRLAGGLLRAADRAPQVSVEVSDVAFTADGRVDIPDLALGLPSLRSASVQSPTASPSVTITHGLWDGGKHVDT